MGMNVEQSGEWELAEETKYSEETCPIATLSTTNPTWPGLGSKQGRSGVKQPDLKLYLLENEDLIDRLENQLEFPIFVFSAQRAIRIFSSSSLVDGYPSPRRFSVFCILYLWANHKYLFVAWHFLCNWTFCNSFGFRYPLQIKQQEVLGWTNLLLSFYTKWKGIENYASNNSTIEGCVCCRGNVLLPIRCVMARVGYS
jgi:hypothetical protein